MAAEDTEWLEWDLEASGSELFSGFLLRVPLLLLKGSFKGPSRVPLRATLRASLKVSLRARLSIPVRVSQGFVLPVRLRFPLRKVSLRI